MSGEVGEGERGLIAESLILLERRLLKNSGDYYFMEEYSRRRIFVLGECVGGFVFWRFPIVW